MSKKTLVLAGAVSAGLFASLLVPAGAVLADPPEGGPTSCMAYEASDVSPAGSEDGTFSQHGMPGIHELTDLFISLGAVPNRGGAYSALAQLHSGSHEQCDDDLGIPPDLE
jgi:hypothetical protein